MDYAPYIPGSITANTIVFSVQAGFPSPADDHATKRIDVLEHLVQHPQATFQFRVRGESMQGVGIGDGDMLIVDRAITPRSGQVVVAVIDNDFTVKTYFERAGRVRLKAANPTYPDIVPKDGQILTVWGVAIACIKCLPK